MSFLIFAAPIIFIIIFVIFVMVFASDSKKYRKNLDNSKQMELDRARENALKAVEEMRRIKQNSQNQNSEEIKRQEHEKSEVLVEQKEQARKSVITKEKVLEQEQPVVNEYQKYYNENYTKGRNKFAKQREFTIPESSETEGKRLVFSKGNLVRGLIAKEYLNRRQGAKRL